MSQTDHEFAEEIRRQAVRLASLFGAIATEVQADSVAGKLALKGGQAALAMCTLAARRNIQADVAAEPADVAGGGYDLAALAAAPPGRIEE